MTGLTLRQAILNRCSDCYNTGCVITDCALYGASRTENKSHLRKRIALYCAWCMNGNLTKLCHCTVCSIYKYKKYVYHKRKEV